MAEESKPSSNDQIPISFIMRIEKDFIGEIEIPETALYGIHSVRARNNFANDSLFHIEWYKALGITKLSVYQVYAKFKNAIRLKYPQTKFPIQFIDDEIIESFIN